MGKKRNSGSVHLRKDGRWEGRLVVGYDDRGYPKTKNVLAKTKRECVEKLSALREQLAPAKAETLAADMPFGSGVPRQLPRGIAKGSGAKPDPFQPRGRLQAPAEVKEGDAGADTRGDAALPDPS